MNLLQLLFGDKIYLISTIIVKIIFLFRGVQYGKNFKSKGFPTLKLKGDKNSIIIKNNVTIIGNVDLRTRESGKIIFEDNSIIESSRLVAARECKLIVGEHSEILPDCIINGGANIIIGNRCTIGARNSINSSKHIVNDKTLFHEKKYTHSPVIIEENCWTGINVVVNSGLTIKKNSIIGANAVLTQSTEANSVYIGIPARKKENS